MTRTTMAVNLIIILTQLLFFTGCDSEISETDPFHKIEKKVIKIAKETNIPSLEVTIRKGKELLNFSYNHADAKKQNIYGIGSTTKFLAAILVFKLIKEQKIDLNEKITEYIHSIGSIHGIEDITVKNLLNHTSGFSDYTSSSEWREKAVNGIAPKTFEEKMIYVKDELTGKGTFSYSNTNYLLLQEIVEFVTEKPFDTVFNEFYNSLGLSEIKMGYADPDLQAFFAQSEEASADVSKWKENYGFDGGVYTNSSELNKLTQLLFAERSILHENTIDQMKEWITMKPTVIPIGTGSLSEYGNGIMKLNYNGNIYIGHSGGTLKYQSFMFYNEKDNTSINIITNCSGKYYNNVFFQELIPAILDKI